MKKKLNQNINYEILLFEIKLWMLYQKIDTKANAVQPVHTKGNSDHKR